MNATGIIFANLHEKNIPELTRGRTIGSIPFGCRYRLIDFTLSNMVNSGITDVRVVTQYNYQSLMDHIGSGKDWDLARHSGGIKVLPPNFIGGQGVQTVRSRLESLISVSESVAHIDTEYVVMADCDGICNLDYTDMLKDHIAHNADITMMVKRIRLTGKVADRMTLIDADEDGRITGIAMNPVYAEGEKEVFVNVTVISTAYLQSVVQDAIAHGYTSLTLDVMMKNIGKRVYRVYRYAGPFTNISSLSEYFDCSMELLHNPAFRRSLFGIEERPILTKVRNSAPVRYAEGCTVKNSLIADGCRIDGNVENCILFRGVKIGRGATVKNCILFQDTVIGENVFMSNVISDKNAVVRDGSVLAGHALKPYYIDKNLML